MKAKVKRLTKAIIIIVVSVVTLSSCGVLPAGGGYQSVKGCPEYAFR